MSSYIVKVQNTSGTTGTVVVDSALSYTDKLSELNEGQLRITGIGTVKRALFEIGSQVFIYRNTTLEFHGIVNALSFLDAGGISADLTGYEIWMGKENGDYAGSPWTATASATIASAVIAESNYFTGGTVEAGESVDFRVEPTSSLWNALSSLTKRTAQDIGVDYANSEIDILDHKGSSTSVVTLNDRVQIQDMTVRHSYPIANDVRVYGQSEGETRIKSDVAQGQDATSKSTYGTIRKIYDDPTVTTVAEANILANKLVAKWKDPVKIYEFDVINPNVSLVAGDVITLNSSAKGLANEEVRIVSMDRGIRDSHEFLTLKVANKAYSQSERSVDKALAELENRANDLQNYDQYGGEYSNQNIDTCVGNGSWFTDALATLAGGQGLMGSGVCGCTGDWTYLNGNLSVPSGTVQAGLLNINTSSIYNRIDGTFIVTGAVTIGAYTIPNTDGTVGQVLCTDGAGTLAWGAGGGGSALWVDATNPYISPCNSCGISMVGDLYDSDSTHWLGVASSPGAFAGVNAACGIFTTCATAPVGKFSTYVCGGDVCAGDDVIAGDDVCATSYLCGAGLNIGASSACAFYVSGNGVYSGTLAITYADTTCTCASRKLRVPVGTNCY